MAATPTDLTLLADVKTALNVSGTNDDAWLQTLITNVSAWVEQETNRKLVARRYNGVVSTHPTTLVPDEDYLYFDGDLNEADRYGNGVHYLPVYPIQANTVVAFQLAILTSRDQNSDVWDTTSLLEGRDYVVDRTLGSIRLLGGAFFTGIKNYRVQAAAGYMLPASAPAAPWVPKDLQQLCIQLVDMFYRGKEGLKQEGIGVWSRQYDTAKDDTFVNRILGAYTRTVL